MLFRRSILVLFALLCVLLVSGFVTGQAEAGLPNQEATPAPQELPAGSASSEACLSCHGKPRLTLPLEDGSLLSLYVDPTRHQQSVHAEENLSCVQCHTNITGPEMVHPPFSAENRRDVTIQLSQLCQNCHAPQYDEAHDSVHEAAILAGNLEAAVCADCHTAHYVERVNDPQTGEILTEARLAIPQTCARCHSAIFEKYLTSVHGDALLNEGNRDVPTCTNCHGVHQIADPGTAEFRLRSPEICAVCHTNPEIMDKYGLSTAVLETYVADFHGTTVTLFEKQHPDQETNKPVCYDCHGVHDIPRVDDPQRGLRVKENLLSRCQDCHPGATTNFPDSWLSHYIPSPEKTPLVYNVNLFYAFFIPAVLGGMGVLVVLDASKQARTTYFSRTRRKRAGEESVTTTEAPAAETPEIEPQESENLSGPVQVEPDEAAAADAVEDLPQAEATDEEDLPAGPESYPDESDDPEAKNE